MAVCGGLLATARNFLDVRLVDLITKLYYTDDTNGRNDLIGFKASVIQIGILCYGLLALCLFVLSILALKMFLHYFTRTVVADRVLLKFSLAEGIAYFTDVFSYLQRFSGKFLWMGASQLVSSVTRFFVVVGLLFVYPTLGGYSTGLLIANISIAAITISVSAHLWKKHEKLNIFSSINLAAKDDYVQNRGFLAWGNINGYSKLLHRAFDVLAVGYFCSDRQTGLYKLARSITDIAYIFYDSLIKLCQPLLFGYLSERRYASYRSMARQIAGWSFGLITLLLICEKWALPSMLKYVFENKFQGAEILIVLLTVPFYFVIGISPWLWPAVVAGNGLRRYTMLSFLAVVVGQYMIALTVIYVTDLRNASIFAGTYGLYYLFLFIPMVTNMRKEAPQIFPFGKSVSV